MQAGGLVGEAAAVVTEAAAAVVTEAAATWATAEAEAGAEAVTLVPAREVPEAAAVAVTEAAASGATAEAGAGPRVMSAAVGEAIASDLLDGAYSSIVMLSSLRCTAARSRARRRALSTSILSSLPTHSMRLCSSVTLRLRW